MPSPVIAPQQAVVNRVMELCDNVLKSQLCLPDLDGLCESEAERLAAEAGAELARLLVRIQLESACERMTMARLAALGLSPEEVRWRRESEYFDSVRTTVGEVKVWTWAFRHRNAAGGWTTQVPARGVVVGRRRTRSSTLTLEWECKVAAMQPFRRCAEELRYFTRGKLTVEDNTIARHIVAIATVMDRQWKYLPHHEIAEILTNSATRDAKTGSPLLYFSCDAHTLRQYEDQSWSAPWKNVNGVRLWCQDRKTGRIIHLGCDFTTGDCNEVVELVEQLAELGVLPRDLSYRARKGDGEEAVPVQAALVVITDGAKWLHKRLEPVLPPATWLLDAYHAFEYLNDYAATLYGKGTKPTRQLYAMLVMMLMGRPPRVPRSVQRPRTWRRGRPRRRESVDYDKLVSQGHGIDKVIAFLETYLVDDRHKVMHIAFVERLRAARERMDYLGARSRGMQIGSGAMESLHRTGSQLRLKRPGARWRPEAAQAVLNLRALELSGRWNEFWSQRDLELVLDRALGAHLKRTRADSAAAYTRMAA